jgi:hypothetical protein
LAEGHRLTEITHKVLLSIRSSISHELDRSEDYRDKFHIHLKIGSNGDSIHYDAVQICLIIVKMGLEQQWVRKGMVRH